MNKQNILKQFSKSLNLFETTVWIGSLNPNINELSIKIIIQHFGPIEINNVQALYLEDGEIVKRFRKDVYPPTEWGI